MTAIAQFTPGYRLTDGTHLNQLVDAVNNATGQGTPAAGTFTTINASGTSTLAAVTATTLNTSGVATLAGGTATTGATTYTLTTVAAAGATQGTATAIAATANNVVVTVTASTEGVKLPTAVTGKKITIWASTTVGVNVYAAAAGQSIGTGSTATTAYALVKNTATTFLATSATKWRVEKGG